MFRVLADSDFVCDVHCTVFSLVSFYRSNRITTFWPEAKPFAKILGQIHKVKVMGWKMSVTRSGRCQPEVTCSTT